LVRLGGVLVVVALLGSTACSSSDDVEAGPASITTSAGEETTMIGTDGGEDAATTEPTTPEEAIGLTESSLTDSTAPLVTTADEIEPKGPIGETALEALLVDQIPGFDRIQTEAADRPLSIEDAAALQPDPTEELPLLETRGYQGGWSRAFRDDQNNVIVITVYDFVSALEADFYLEDGTITLIGDGGTIYEVATIPDARGFKQETQDASGSLVVYGITFTRGNQWFLVTLLGDPEAATPDLVLTAAENQSALVD
jgi:hypothetical protein